MQPRRQIETETSEAYERFKVYWGVAIAVAVTVAVGLLTKDTILQVMDRGLASAITIVAVLGSTIVVFGFYMYATENELALARPYIAALGPPDLESVTIILALAICFGALLAFATNLLAYCGILICLQGTDLAGTALVRHKFRQVENKVKHVSAARHHTLRHYYLKRHQLLLRSLRLLGTVLALCLGIYARHRHSFLLTELAWTLVVVSMLATEGFHKHWRSERDQALK